MKKKVFIIDQNLFLRRAYVNSEISKTASFKGKKYQVYRHLVFSSREEGIEYYKQNKIMIQMSSDRYIQRIIDKNNFKIRFRKISDEVICFYSDYDEFIVTDLKNRIELRHLNKVTRKHRDKRKNKTHSHVQRYYSNLYQVLDSVNSHRNYNLDYEYRENQDARLKIAL